MKQGTRRKRLDEILIEQNLISEFAIREALMRQKAHGGRFGSQLLYYRYIDEATLVKALSVQLGCDGVVVSSLEIPQDVVGMIPMKVALARKVMPFEYDPQANVLKVACEDPTDQGLMKELAFVARGKEIKPFVAAEIALNTVIARYHLGRDTSLDDNLLLEIPDEATRTGDASLSDEPAGNDQIKEGDKLVLLVTDEEYAASLLQSLLERQDFRVSIADSIDGAINQLRDRRFHTVFIKDSIASGETNLEDQVRRISPGTVVHRYENVASLLLNDAPNVVDELLLRNLDLLISLLSSRARLPANHSGLVGQYADRLCRKLRLADKDHLLITNAAYLHDLAKFYYGTDDPEDNRKAIHLTVKLLTSLNYSPPVIDILRAMYADLDQKYALSLPLDVLGGNILTVADLFCNATPHDQPLSLDRFEGIKKKMRDLVGKLFLPEIVEGFIEMIQDEILNLKAVKRSVQVLVYSEDPTAQRPLELRLKNEGFVTVPLDSTASLIELYKRSEPDLLVLVVIDRSAEVAAFVDQLISSGIQFDRTPTFLVTDTPSISNLTGLLDRGIEDIIGLQDNLDLLVSKIHRIAARISSKATPEVQTGGASPGARGRLVDINLIDLIQALGPGRRTVRIAVHPDKCKAAKLTVYLNQGSIVFAEFDDLAGAEAVYEGLTWADGTWKVEPVAPEDLPSPNNDLSNEAILMEGCRLLDEKVKAGHLL